MMAAMTKPAATSHGHSGRSPPSSTYSSSSSTTVGGTPAAAVEGGVAIIVAAVAEAAAAAAAGRRSTCVAVSDVVAETLAPRATRSRSASISSALWYRSSGLLASARKTTMSSSRGMSGRSLEGGCGAFERCFIAISTGVSPSKGVLPVSSS